MVCWFAFFFYVPDSTASAIGGSAPEREIQHLFAEIDRNASEVCMHMYVFVYAWPTITKTGIQIGIMGSVLHMRVFSGSFASQGKVFA
jgi:hypothetical protein